MDEPRRNDAFDHELRRALAAGGGAPSGSHVDAEVAAAWIERRLDASTQQAVEAHLANCADCQATLATLARISPDGASERDEGRAWWRRLRAGWLVPATVAAAAALVIWVAVPQQRQAPERTASLASPPSTSPTTTAQEPAAPAPAPAPAASADAQASLNLERREGLADASAPAAPPPQPQPQPAPAGAAPPAAPAAESDKASAKLEAEAPPIDSLRESITVTGQSPALPASPRQDAAGSASARRLDSLAARAAVTGPSPLVVLATDGARWRRTGATIEFAPRGNAPFTAATLPISADAIVAGSSPGGTVCWLVGRAGVVLVSTDGLRFTRATMPAPIDLVAVTATDAREATVIARGGRQFRTTDQGATWSPQ